MEAKTFRDMVITACAPLAWGSTYYVTRQHLPLESPITGAAIRALPAGILLLLIARELPRGSWWWRSALIGLLTVSGFFVLIYVAGTRLPSSVAATLMATSAVVVLVLARIMLGERAPAMAYGGGLIGLAGVAFLVSGAVTGLDPLGVGASLLAMLSSSIGFVLTKRWKPPVSPLTFAAWQLTLGGMMLVPIALLVEGSTPTLDLDAARGFTYLVLVGTALAYVVWFHGLRHLPAGTVALIGLLNPLSGTMLGMLAAGEVFTLSQTLGAAAILLGVTSGIRSSTSANIEAARSSPVAPSTALTGLR